MQSEPRPKKLLDRVRDAVRLKHYYLPHRANLCAVDSPLHLIAR